jgi:hypothetical protein
LSWQSKIYHKFRLDESVVKIISDHTGLITDRLFFDFLEQENKDFLVTNTVPELLEALKYHNKLLICNRLDIPSFINKKVEVINFRFDSIPISGNPRLLEKKTKNEVIAILDFIENTPLREDNIESICREAKRLQANYNYTNLLNSIETLVLSKPTIDSVLQLSKLWAEVQYQGYILKDTSFSYLTHKIDDYCNPFFKELKWQDAFYAPISNPKTVDKIIHKIKNDNAEKKALLCFDCMGMPEWLLLKEHLEFLGLSFVESQVFTLLPSITSIGRRAIFAGTYEVYDKKSPGQVTEEKDFKDFFGNNNSLYIREKDYTNSDLLIGFNNVSILFNFFDDLSHSAIIQENFPNKFSYYNSVSDYLKNSKVKCILNDLLEQGFAIYFCSDHGSIVAKGNGKKFDKYLQEQFAKRAILISSDSAELTEYEKVTIPFINNRIVAIPENREMFANNNQLEINHGGLTIDEMVVPFIKIKNS